MRLRFMKIMYIEHELLDVYGSVTVSCLGIYGHAVNAKNHLSLSLSVDVVVATDLASNSEHHTILCKYFGSNQVSFEIFLQMECAN